MDTAHTIYEKFIGSDNPKIIINSALEIQKHFSSISKKEPNDETGEELLYLLRGKEEALEWLLFLIINYVNDEKSGRLLAKLNSIKKNISVKQSEWAILILSDIKSKMSEIYFDQCTELIDTIKKEIEIKKSISIEEEKKDIILEEESKKMKVGFWYKIGFGKKRKEVEISKKGGRIRNENDTTRDSKFDFINLPFNYKVPKSGKYKCCYCMLGGMIDLVLIRLSERSGINVPKDIKAVRKFFINSGTLTKKFSDIKKILESKHEVIKYFSEGDRFSECPNCGKAAGWTLLEYVDEVIMK